jgi:nucleoid-associated protein YgaU
MTLKNFLKKVKLSERTISAVLGVLVVGVAGILLFNFFQSRGGIEDQRVDLIDQEVETEETKTVILPVTYRVVQGDNLWQIAKDYYGSGYNWVDIAQENSLRNPDFLLVDQELLIPDVPVRWPEEKLAAKGEPGSTYVVQKGDSLWKIAVAVYDDGYQWPEIYQANEAEIGANPGLIETGMVLALP